MRAAMLCLIAACTVGGGSPAPVAATRSRIGVLVHGDFTTGQRRDISLALGVDLVRDAVVMDRYTGTLPSFEAYRAAGLDVALNVNWTRVGQDAGPQPFATDLPAYTARLGEILDRYRPVLVVIENEELTRHYHSGPIGDYVALLAAAAPVVHARGLQLTDGGLTAPGLDVLVYRDLVAQGRHAEAEVYAAHTMRAGVHRSVVAGDDPELEARAADADAVLAGAAPLDYINIHGYEPFDHRVADPAAVTGITPGILAARKAYVERRTGKPCISNELGQKHNEQPALTRALLAEAVRLGFPFIIWYSGDGDADSIGARALQNPDGSLRPTGEAFRDFVEGR